MTNQETLDTLVENIETLQRQRGVAVRKHKGCVEQIAAVRNRTEDVTDAYAIRDAYASIREAQAERDEANIEIASLEHRIAVLEHKADRQELRVVADEIAAVIAQKDEKLAQAVQLVGLRAARTPGPAGEVGVLNARIANLEARRVDINQGNQTRQAKISQKRARLDAVLEGASDPGTTTRTDSMGRIVESPVIVGY